MNKAETIKAAAKAFDILALRFPEITKAYDAAVESEKRHRRGEFRRYHPRAASVHDVAQMFAVRFVAEYATRVDAMPTMKDYFRLRPDALAAAAVVAMYGADDILEILRVHGNDPEALAKMDYVTLVGKVDA